MSTIKDKNMLSLKQGLGITGIVMLIIGILGSIITPLFDSMAGKDLSLLLTVFFTTGPSFVIVYWMRKKKTKTVEFNFKAENIEYLPMMIIASTALLFAFIVPIVTSLPIPQAIQEVLQEFMVGRDGVFSFLAIVFAGPILEELIFRGIILDGFLKKYSPVKSILLSAVLFGIVHMNPWQFLTGFLMGSLIGWVYYKTRSTLNAIIMHVMNNLIVFLSTFYLGEDVQNVSFIENYGGAINAVLIIGSGIAILTIALFILNKRLAKPKLILDV